MPGTFDYDETEEVQEEVKKNLLNENPGKSKKTTSKKNLEKLLEEKLPEHFKQLETKLEKKILSNFQDSSIDLTKIPLENLKVIVNRYFTMHSPRAWNKGESSFENKTLRLILKAKGGQHTLKHNKNYRIFTLNESLFNGIEMREMTKTKFTEYQKQKQNQEKKKN